MKFEAEFKAVLTFTRDEVEFLAECCNQHYDAHIRSLVIPGKGAIVNGMRTGLVSGMDSTSSSYTYRQIDSLMKAIEDGKGAIAAILRPRLWTAMDKIGKLTAAANTLLEIFA